MPITRISGMALPKIYHAGRQNLLAYIVDPLKMSPYMV